MGRRVTMGEYGRMSDKERERVTTVTFDTETLHVLRSELDHRPGAESGSQNDDRQGDPNES